MYKLAFVAAAAAALALTSAVAPNSAQAGTRVTVSPVYVPAIYCDYKSAAWKTKGIVTCPTGWWPIGAPGTRWQVSKTLTQCWSTNTAAGKDFAGYWKKC
ncbi:MAG: hypothetical protein AB7S93_10205 [Xanthobacteraceae bacterium]